MSNPDFDVKWRAFAEGDAQVKAPSRVRRTVMEAWDTAPKGRVPARLGRSYGMPAVAALAAAAAIIAVGVAVRDIGRGSDGAKPAPVSRLPESAPLTVPSRRAEPDSNAGRSQVTNQAGPPVRLTMTRDADERIGVVRFIADPTFETESLRIVRLRLPRTNLEAFGVALLEPETSSLVDVDVVVGDDGLPLEIRRIRAVR
jgi:hypothetical protein